MSSGRTAASTREKATSHGSAVADAKPTAPTDGRVDGRRARAERNRSAVVDAFLALLREGKARPSAAEIASRAGVSLRSVFRHFDDLETLYAEAVARHSELIAPLFLLDLPPVPAGHDGVPLDARIAAIVRQRAELFEELTPIRLASTRLMQHSPAVRQGIDRGRRRLRRQLTDLFQAELDAHESRERRELLDALELVTSFAAWNALRADQALTMPRARAALERSVRSLLGA